MNICTFFHYQKRSYWLHLLLSLMVHHRIGPHTYKNSLDICLLAQPIFILLIVSITLLSRVDLNYPFSLTFNSRAVLGILFIFILSVCLYHCNIFIFNFHLSMNCRFLSDDVIHNCLCFHFPCDASYLVFLFHLSVCPFFSIRH